MLEGVVLGVLLSFGIAFTVTAQIAGAVLARRRSRARRPWILRRAHSPTTLSLEAETAAAAAERLAAGIVTPRGIQDQGNDAGSPY